MENHRDLTRTPQALRTARGLYLALLYKNTMRTSQGLHKDSKGFCNGFNYILILHTSTENDDSLFEPFPQVGNEWSSKLWEHVGDKPNKNQLKLSTVFLFRIV
jgi:hypothetical protein